MALGVLTQLWGPHQQPIAYLSRELDVISCGWASLVAQRLKRLAPMWETRGQSLGWEDPLEKEMATHSSILAWRIPWREEPGRLQSAGSQRVRHNWATSLQNNRIHIVIKFACNLQETIYQVSKQFTTSFRQKLFKASFLTTIMWN